MAAPRIPTPGLIPLSLALWALIAFLISASRRCGV